MTNTLRTAILAALLSIVLAAAPAPADPFDELVARAESGDANAQYRLGAMYAYGDRVAINPQKAFHWLEKAAGQGHAEAANSLGSLYESGSGVERDLEAAVDAYTRGALHGSELAWHNLVLLHASVEQDLLVKEALKISEDQVVAIYDRPDDGTALYRLALRFDFGSGLPLNDTLARRLYRLAADRGHVKAQYNLGLMYESGQGGERDDEQAVRHYTRAARAGFPDAQYNLALKYATGRGVPQDWKLAFVWTALAAATGDASAGRNRDAFASRLTEEELRQAEQLVTEMSEEMTPWVPEPPDWRLSR